ncbi:MAG: response regulator [Planctomycetota bacterium]|nr:MAG: response regulator [Planctomycetota bacterium]REJ93625.1 MAG: response regulator [Planctomycetota bacterium]REK30748.1 MAG: response regulator [Planctomycetota bacterium]REK33123.1 MAG: response regulator [Planctomycetota bacterium]
MARIVVVEDADANVEILTRLLTRSGHEVIVAGTRDAAVETIRQEKPALVLMDIGIPNSDGDEVNMMGGLEVTEAVRADQHTAGIPIIATSASAMPDDKQRFRDAGCNDIVSKPYDFTELLETINKHISG